MKDKILTFSVKVEDNIHGKTLCLGQKAEDKLFAGCNYIAD